MRKISNTSALQFFQVFRWGSILLTGILLTKSSLDSNGIGLYESLVFLAGAVSFFWVSGLIQSLLAFPDPLNGKRKPLYFNAAIILFVMGLLAAVFILVFDSAIRTHFKVPDTGDFMPLMALFIVLSAPAFLVEYIYLLNNKPKSIIFYGLTSYSLQVALVILPVFSGFPLEWALGGLVVSAAIRFIWLIVLLIKHASFQFYFPYIKEHIRLAIPLVISTLLSGSGEYIDGFIITNFFDSSTFAVYRYGAREFPLFLLLANALSNSMIHEVASEESPSESLSNLRDRSARLMNILFPIAGILMISSHWFYPRVFNPAFAQSASVFNIYLLLLISRLVFPQTIVIAKRKTKIIVFASVVEIILNVSLSLFLLQFMGIAGVALGTVIAYLAEKTILMIYCRVHLDIKPSKYIPVEMWLLYSTFLLIAFAVSLFKLGG
ncbi:MAG: oligosaccharide flippase family protein [Bacteroidota bacterium]